MSLTDCSTISNDTDTSFDAEDIPTGNVKLETETDVTQKDSTPTLNSYSEIIIKAKQSLDKLFSDNEVNTDLEAAILHVNAKLIELKNENNAAGRTVYGSTT